MKQIELNILIENIVRRVLKERTHVIGYTDPVATISRDILSEIKSLIDAKDFNDNPDEWVNYGSFQTNYEDFYITISSGPVKPEFDDKSLLIRGTYLNLDFSEFGNIQDKVVAEFRKIAGGHFNKYNKTFYIGRIEFRPKKDEIDYREDLIKLYLKDFVLAVNKLYKKYPKLTEPGNKTSLI